MQGGGAICFDPFDQLVTAYEDATGLGREFPGRVCEAAVGDDHGFVAFIVIFAGDSIADGCPGNGVLGSFDLDGVFVLTLCGNDVGAEVVGRSKIRRLVTLVLKEFADVYLECETVHGVDIVYVELLYEFLVPLRLLLGKHELCNCAQSQAYGYQSAPAGM